MKTTVGKGGEGIIPALSDYPNASGPERHFAGVNLNNECKYSPWAAQQNPLLLPTSQVFIEVITQSCQPRMSTHADLCFHFEIMFMALAVCELNQACT